MRTLLVLVITSFVATVVSAEDAPSTREIKREELGRSVKYTCVVDKVMQKHKKWVAEEWMIREAAQAGFNIYSPRVGHEKLDAVRQVTAWCEEYGIYHLPWMRGTLAVGLDNPKADGKRVVWASGSEQPLWSPNSDELWAWMTKYIVAYAEMSAENEHILGVFLDYENYAPGQRGGNLYSLSYDWDVLDRFGRAEAIDIPDLAPAERKPWLDEQGLHGAFEAFQVAEWRRRCRELRVAVDQHAPNFQFWLYPVPGTPFLQQAAYPELSTKAGPIVVADQSTYGRPTEFMPEAAAVTANRKELEKNLAIPREMGIPFHYAGGIDPVVRGADPEFSGKNAVAISDVTDGYWIFYEGPDYEGEHQDYWTWFTWANEAIAEGRWEAQNVPRQTDEGFIAELSRQIGETGFANPAAIGQPVEFPLHKLRRTNLVLLACKAGAEVTVQVRDIRLGSYTDPLHWELRSPDYAAINSGEFEHEAGGTIRFMPDRDGVYFLGISSGACSYAIERANVPMALYAGKGVSTVHGAEQLYFHVPADTRSFTVHLEGSGAETVRGKVFDPAGELAGTAQTTPSNRRASFTVDTGEKNDAVWSLSLGAADEGTLEDARVRIEGVPPLLTLDPKHVFR